MLVPAHAEISFLRWFGLAWQTVLTQQQYPGPRASNATMASSKTTNLAWQPGLAALASSRSKVSLRTKICIRWWCTSGRLHANPTNANDRRAHHPYILSVRCLTISGTRSISSGPRLSPRSPRQETSAKTPDKSDTRPKYSNRLKNDPGPKYTGDVEKDEKLFERYYRGVLTSRWRRIEGLPEWGYKQIIS